MRSMKSWVSIGVLPLVVLASACSRERASRIAAPGPPGGEEPQIAEARWVWEREALGAAIRAAGTSPLVQRALGGTPIVGLRSRSEYAVRAVGRTVEGTSFGLTILPFEVAEDPTHAAFVSVADGLGLEAAEVAELIVGRDPRSDEVRFHAAHWNGQTVWVKTADPYMRAAPAASGAPGRDLSPMKRQWTKLFDCLLERMPLGCAAGAGIAKEIAPAYPHSAAIGCGIGAAGAAGSCVLDFLSGR